MKYRIQRKVLTTEELWNRTALWLSFFLPVIIVFTIFIANRIYPFGDRSFLFSDMYHQYMPFFSEFLRAVRSGEGLNYTWNVGIGSNFLALYAYYLASPLHWLAFLVPEAYLMEFMSYLTVVKIGLCGWSSFLYLQKKFEGKDGGALFFSCFYALSGFMMAYNWNIMWLDCVILLPFILLGLERLVREGRCGLYCIALALSILTNFYISILICIFLVMYFLSLLVTEKCSRRILIDFALYSLLAGGMAAVLLVPEVLAILATDFGDVSLPDKLQSYFPVLDELARHCLGVSTERGLDHWPNIYCGAAVFVLIPLYALNQGIPARKRFCNLVLLGVFLFAFANNIPDMIWHGMNYPDSLPARQSFIYILLVLTMCYDAYRHINQVSKHQILYSYLGAAVFLLACEKFISHEDFETGIELLTLVFVTVYAVLLYLLRSRGDKNGGSLKPVLGGVALFVIIVELGINSYYTSFGTTDRTAYLGELSDYRTLYGFTREREDGFYRLEKFTRKTKNDGTLAAYPTASVFSSTMNSYVMDLYRLLGMRNSKVYYGFDGATPLSSALLNVKYMFGNSSKYENDLYTVLDHSGEVWLYENRAVLPFGYVAPVGFDLPRSDDNNVILYQSNAMLVQNRLVGELGVEESLFVRVQDTDDGDDVVVRAQQDGIYYARLTAGGTREIDVVGGQLEVETYNDLRDNSIIYLGHLMEGDKITLTNGDDKDETPKIAVDVYRLDQEVLERVLARLSQSHLENVTYGSDWVNGDLTLTEAGRLILSIPYEKGWTVKVNGQKTECSLFGDCLIALDLEPGVYHIELSNVPAGLYLGIGITLVSAAAFAALWILGPRIGRKNGAEDDEEAEDEDEREDDGEGEGTAAVPEDSEREAAPGKGIEKDMTAAPEDSEREAAPDKGGEGEAAVAAEGEA